MKNISDADIKNVKPSRNMAPDTPNFPIKTAAIPVPISSEKDIDDEDNELALRYSSLGKNKGNNDILAGLAKVSKVELYLS